MSITFLRFLAYISAASGNSQAVYDVSTSSTIKTLHTIMNGYANALALTDKDVPIPKMTDSRSKKARSFTFGTELDSAVLNNTILDLKLEESITIPNQESSTTVLIIKSSASRNAADGNVPEC